MVLASHYRVLGLRSGASFTDVKLAYRRLVRLYHPDVNPDNEAAKEKFIQITQAYQAVVKTLPQPLPTPKTEVSTGETTVVRKVSPSDQVPYTSAPPPPRPPLQVSQPPGGSRADQDLKQSSFIQLQGLLKSRRYPRAVALVEGLVHRFPQDLEVRQWQAIAYYRWGQASLNLGDRLKAEACLKKAWRVDPYNRSLRQALQYEFSRLQRLSTPLERVSS
jgi:tetratricopeptide (TPR) repeat protein